MPQIVRSLLRTDLIGGTWKKPSAEADAKYLSPRSLLSACASWGFCTTRTACLAWKEGDGRLEDSLVYYFRVETSCQPSEILSLASKRGALSLKQTDSPGVL